jgi:hypothetical protein
LVPGNKGLFLSARELPEREYGKPERPVVVVIYELVEADSTGDGRLTASDVKTIAVSDPSGSHFTKVLTGVEDLGRPLQETAVFSFSIRRRLPSRLRRSRSRITELSATLPYRRLRARRALNEQPGTSELNVRGHG